MALVFFDGFDHYASAEASAVKGYGMWGGAVFSTTEPCRRTGNRYASFPATGDFDLSVPPDDVYTVGFAYYGDAASPGDVEVQFSYDSTVQCTVDVSNGGIAGYRGVTTLLGSAAGVYPVAGVWCFIEAKVYVHDSTGYIVVRVNETVVLELTGQDTQNSSTTSLINKIVFNLSPPGSTRRLDDLYVCDNTGAAPFDSFLGSVFVDTLWPDADGDVNEWTANTGNRYQAVDDPTDVDDDTTYVYTEVDETKQLFSMGACASDLGAILAVRTCLVGKKSSSPAVNLRPLFRTAGDSDYEGGMKAFMDSYSGMFGLWTKNPDDDADWEPTDIDNGQFGMIFTYTTTTTV